MRSSSWDGWHAIDLALGTFQELDECRGEVGVLVGKCLIVHGPGEGFAHRNEREWPLGIRWGTGRW